MVLSTGAEPASENEVSTFPTPANGAESVLLGLKFHGVDYLFANAGTDFPPIIEALCNLPAAAMPEPITIPHETASVGMAHGYFLVTGRPQAVMVHVNVGLANAVMGVINAASDNVPVLVMSGRTPITESGRKGSRMSPIQYGQEMFDQSSLVSDTVKYHYEMRYPEQGEPLVSRALALAKSEPAGPTYLSLPREPLTEVINDAQQLPFNARPATSRMFPDPEKIKEIVGLLKKADNPLILVQRGDVEGKLSKVLQSICLKHAIAVCEPFPVRNVMPSAHPMFVGHDIKSALTESDLIIALDCDIPWLEAFHKPPLTTPIVHIGPDPHFARMPMRGYKTDIALQSDPIAAMEALDQAIQDPMPETEQRKLAIAKRNSARHAKIKTLIESGNASPIGAEWLSHCISEAMDETAIVFSELGVLPGMMQLKGPNRVFANPHSGGLGWAMTAALGAQLADLDRLVISCIGDGSYVFANPTACHQIAEALQLPLLTIIKNNGMWNAVRRSVVDSYPEGVVARTNKMPLTSLEPAPDYLKIAEASRAYTERVEKGEDLPAALARAIKVIREEKRQVLLEIKSAVSDTF